MGIYFDGGVYGVSFILDEDILFEEKYAAQIAPPQIRKVKECYDKLSAQQKNRLIIHFYTLCSSTYSSSKSEPFMSWMLGSKEGLEQLLSNYE